MIQIFYSQNNVFNVYTFSSRPKLIQANQREGIVEYFHMFIQQMKNHEY